MFVSCKVSSELSLRHFLGASVLIDSSHGLASLTLLCQPHYAGIRVRKIYLAFFCLGWGGSIVIPLGNGHKTDLWFLMAEVIPQSTGTFCFMTEVSESFNAFVMQRNQSFSNQILQLWVSMHCE